MEFRNRSDQSAPAGRTTSGQVQTPSSTPTPRPASSSETPKSSDWQAPSWLRFVYVLLLFSLTILCVSVAYFLSTYNPNESKYVIDNKYQAVFLSNGQAYFGKIKHLNNQYIDLQDIYYLNTQTPSSQSSSTNNQVSLVKLGCELHQPYDQMLINHSVVTYWENLNDNGQVVKKIKQWQQENPNGLTCPTSTSSTNQSTSTTTPSTSSTSSTSAKN